MSESLGRSWRADVRGIGLALALLCVLLAPGDPKAVADDSWLFQIEDPRGADRGTGDLMYPRRDDLQPGDLDLREFAARGVKGGTEFVATFHGKIASPEGRIGPKSGTRLETIARLGFYSFNLDLYLDLDRVPGQGDTTALPGRRVRIDPAWGWEKAVCVTPRPVEARRELRRRHVEGARAAFVAEHGRIDPATEDSLARAVETELDARVLFPTQVRVRGRTVAFFVPESYLPPIDGGAWGGTVLVTATMLEDRVPLGAMLGVGKPAEPGLFNVPVAMDATPEAFGGASAGDDLLPPVVDLLQPEAGVQEEMLRSYDLRTRRLAAVSGVVFATAAATPR